MLWRVVRIDFTERCACVFGSKTHDITSGKGFVVVDHKGNERFAGPDCVRNPNYVSNPGEKVPDLTKGCLEPGGEVGGDTSKAPPKIATGEVGGTSKKDDHSNQNAIAYLLLRVEKLKNFPKIKYKKLDELYERYQRDSLTEGDFIFLNKLIESKSFPEYSLRNLQAIYACEFWINQFIKVNQDKDLSYVDSLKSYLHAKLALTPSQISGLNKWFDNSSGRKMVKLKPNPFVIDPSEYWKKN
ncbi:hypothetical protein SOASR015_35630 [Pectobacterium carotovorum subsp. carotovorum]|nr:hypothetical protein SOASR015_35630 [Pectobacterium carotovorum subsp. carotovorum]GLX58313.1 hypothetical protein Pcaca02_36220 [Pectobacterium carotovorum subsp. carotovorum]